MNNNYHERTLGILDGQLKEREKVESTKNISSADGQSSPPSQMISIKKLISGYGNIKFNLKGFRRFRSCFIARAIVAAETTPVIMINSPTRTESCLTLNPSNT